MSVIKIGPIRVDHLAKRMRDLLPLIRRIPEMASSAGEAYTERMADEMKPALTPDQWGNRMLPGVVCANVRYDVRHRRWFHELAIFHSDDTKDSLHAALSPEQAHGIAALMLHQQSFGPRSDWVSWLDEEIAIWEREDGRRAGQLVLRDIRDFLAALLPPEKSSFVTTPGGIPVSRPLLEQNGIDTSETCACGRLMIHPPENGSWPAAEGWHVVHCEHGAIHVVADE